MDSKIKNFWDRVFYYPWLAINFLVFIVFLLLSAIVTFFPDSMQGESNMNELLLKYAFPVFVIFVFICAFTIGISELIRWINRRHKGMKSFDAGMSKNDKHIDKEIIRISAAIKFARKYDNQTVAQLRQELELNYEQAGQLLELLENEQTTTENKRGA